MIVIGVTGGVGTGKSTVAKMLGDLGARVLDADAIAHESMRPGMLAWRRIVETFGEAVVHPDRTINRQQLARIVFDDPEARRRLEAIVHPQVIKEVKRRLHAWQKHGRHLVVALDVPLLLEAGLDALVDVVVVVRADPAVQRARLADGRGWSAAEIARRVNAQWSLAVKEERADAVVENSGRLSETRRQVTQLWKKRCVVPRNSGPTARARRPGSIWRRSKTKKSPS